MPQTVPLPLRGPFTVADYHRMGELGLLDEDSRVELLDGLIVEASKIGPRQAGCVNQLTRFFILAGADQVTVATRNPVILDEYSEPLPDVAVLKYRADGYAVAHPGPDDVLLLIEVMDSSVYRDRQLKLPLYARAGIRELWLVDLEGDVVDVYREPGPDGYAVERRAVRGERLTPSLLDFATLPVSDILG